MLEREREEVDNYETNLRSEARPDELRISQDLKNAGLITFFPTTNYFNCLFAPVYENFAEIDVSNILSRHLTLFNTINYLTPNSSDKKYACTHGMYAHIVQ